MGLRYNLMVVALGFLPCVRIHRIAGLPHPYTIRGGAMRTSENSVKKLSEKSCRHPKRSCTEPRHRTVRPILAPIYRPIPRSERRSNPFSDSFMTEFSLPIRPVLRAYPVRGLNKGRY